MLFRCCVGLRIRAHVICSWFTLVGRPLCLIPVTGVVSSLELAAGCLPIKLRQVSRQFPTPRFSTDPCTPSVCRTLRSLTRSSWLGQARFSLGVLRNVCFGVYHSSNAGHLLYAAAYAPASRQVRHSSWPVQVLTGLLPGRRANELGFVCVLAARGSSLMSS